MPSPNQNLSDTISKLENMQMKATALAMLVGQGSPQPATGIALNDFNSAKADYKAMQTPVDADFAAVI